MAFEKAKGKGEANESIEVELKRSEAEEMGKFCRAGAGAQTHYTPLSRGSAQTNKTNKEKKKEKKKQTRRRHFSPPDLPYSSSQLSFHFHSIPPVPHAPFCRESLEIKDYFMQNFSKEQMRTRQRAKSQKLEVNKSMSELIMSEKGMKNNFITISFHFILHCKSYQIN